VGSTATSGNQATTNQTGTQSAGGSAIQVLGQEARTDQLALAGSSATQSDPSNTSSPTRVYSPGGNGALTQSNTAGSTAASGNTATTGQEGNQAAGSAQCGCYQPPIQVAGPQADTGQFPL